jgi:hypothetical protein
MLLFHGTTLENAKKIQKEGFSYDKQNWNCSNEETYFFSEEFFRSECGSEDFSDMWDTAIRHTLDQARITLAIENPKVYRSAVLVFDTSLMNNKDKIEKDYSCENMEDCAVVLENPDLNGLVAVVYSTNDEKESRPVMLALMKSNCYFEMPEISCCLNVMVDALSENPDCLMNVMDELKCSEEYLTTWTNENLLNQDYSREEVEEVA